ncbi:MAG: hypothetical protein EON50_08275 [Acidovorax sp.]|nr:MAG: hypothetical protein EON50_08275 [Acidovorax sp.]
MVPEDILSISRGKKNIQLNAGERKWLAKGKIYTDKDLKVGSDKHFALSHLDGGVIFVSIGFDEFSSTLSDHFDEIDLNGGLFLALINELDIYPLSNEILSLRAMEEVFLPISEDRWLNLQDIEKYFSRFKFFTPKENSSLLSMDDLHLSLIKFSIFALTCSQRVMDVAFSSNYLDGVHRLCSMQNRLIPWGRIFRVLTERRVENSFLELYRCVEILYPLARIAELKDLLGTQKGHLDISSVIETTLGWRPQEEQAIVDLLSNVTDDLKNRLVACHGDGMAAAKLFYKVRNHCVHLRPLHQKNLFLETLLWSDFLDVSIELVYEIYAKSFCEIDG